jgi:hypothetical protein
VHRLADCLPLPLETNLSAVRSGALPRSTELQTQVLTSVSLSQ